LLPEATGIDVRSPPPPQAKAANDDEPIAVQRHMHFGSSFGLHRRFTPPKYA
jgi:hypothetical protein